MGRKDKIVTRSNIKVFINLVLAKEKLGKDEYIELLQVINKLEAKDNE